MDALFSRKTAMIAHMEKRPRNVSSWLLTVACAAIAGVVTPLQPMWAYPVPPATENPASRSVTFALQQGVPQPCPLLMSTGSVTWTACSNAGRFGRWLSTASLLSFTTRGSPRGALQGLNLVAREMGQE